jgi:hypothetical protein
MYILIPPDVQIVDMDTGEPVMKADDKGVITSEPLASLTMQRFLVQVIYNNPYLGADGEDIADRIWRLRHLFFGAKAGDVIEVPVDDVKAVCAVFLKPDGDGSRTTGKCDRCGGRPAIRWRGEIASFGVPFIRAWKNATTERPPTS